MVSAQSVLLVQLPLLTAQLAISVASTKYFLQATAFVLRDMLITQAESALLALNSPMASSSMEYVQSVPEASSTTVTTVVDVLKAKFFKELVV